MSDYIKREDAIDLLEQVINAEEFFNTDNAKAQSDLALWFEERISELPKADVAEWIPVNERLPEESGEYLVRPSDGILEDYSDFSEVMIMPYDADCEAFGYDPVTLGYVDGNFNEYEVVAWMPLPEPYKAESEEE